MSRRTTPELIEHRHELLEGLTGRVIELGAGDGINFALYPTTVTEVVAVEPEPYLYATATEGAKRAPVPVTVVDATADQLPFPAESFDAAVASLVLCSVADQPAALVELHRVVRPGGELRFYEHGRSPDPHLARTQRLVDWLFWPRLFGGCHTSRDTLAGIAAAGFRIEQRRFVPAAPKYAFPVGLHALGRARRA